MLKVLVVCDYCMANIIIEDVQKKPQITVMVSGRRFDFCSYSHYKKFFKLHPEFEKSKITENLLL